MSCREQIGPNIKHNIRMLFIFKKLSEAFLFLYGTLIVIGLFMVFYINNFHPQKFIRGTYDREKVQRMRELWYLMNNLFLSMIISGIIGTIIFTPSTFLIGRRLKIIESTIFKKKYAHNEDSFKFQRILKSKPKDSILRGSLHSSFNFVV